VPQPQPNRPRQMNGPWPVRHDHHPGRRLRQAGLLIEQSQARGEDTGIAAPVRMIRPDEIPPPAFCLIHPCSPSAQPALMAGPVSSTTYQVSVCNGHGTQPRDGPVPLGGRFGVAQCAKTTTVNTALASLNRPTLDS
jgi:hypothetical protein